MRWIHLHFYLPRLEYIDFPDHCIIPSEKYVGNSKLFYLHVLIPILIEDVANCHWNLNLFLMVTSLTFFKMSKLILTKTTKLLNWLKCYKHFNQCHKFVVFVRINLKQWLKNGVENFKYCFAYFSTATNFRRYNSIISGTAIPFRFCGFVSKIVLLHIVCVTMCKRVDIYSQYFIFRQILR